MGDLSHLVETVVDEYAVDTFDGVMYAMHNDAKTAFSVIFAGDGSVLPVVLARIANDLIIVERDQTNKPLVDALVQAGVPRERIILAYAGETLETA